MSASSRTFRRLVSVLATLAFVGVGLELTAPAVSAAGSDTSTRQIVTFVAGTSATDRDAALTAAGATEVSSVPQLRMAAVAVTAAGADALRADARVAGVEADRVRDVEAAPSDPSYDDQWALPKIGWDQAYGSVNPQGSTLVAVLDTGVDATTDLAGKLVPGASMLAGSDGTADPNGHGTAMASIVAAATDNGVGIAGVGYDGVSVMPIKVLGADGTGQDSDIAAGVVYAADHGADVILMSFSNPGRSDALQAAVDFAWSKGAVLVAATGNDGSSSATYPAGTAKVVGVSATTRDDSLWSGSNSGSDTFLGAPGVDIATGSGALTGTSTSAAIVAGTAALVKANDSAASNGVVVGRLARTADPAGSAADTGNGRVNLARALADTSDGAVVPQGVVGDGGPYVGPYAAAANISGTLQGQESPACSSGGICPWQTTSLNGWSELQTIPLRLFFGANQSSANPTTFSIAIDHSQGNGATPGLAGLTNFAKSGNVTVIGGFPPSFTSSSGGDIWTYTFQVDLTDNNPGFITFDTSLLAGAHNVSGNSLQVKGAGTLGIFKPGAAPGSPNLALSKTAPASVVAGQTMTYTLNYQNLASGSGTTNQATGTQLTDTLPAGVSYVSGTCVGCTYDSVTRTLTWNIGTVNAGATSSRTFQVVVDGSLANGATVTNTAQIRSAENDADLSNNTASATTTVVAAVISGQVIFDANGDGVFDPGEIGLKDAIVSLFKDTNNNGSFDVGTDLQVGSSVTTPISGEWAFTSGLTAGSRYFVVRTNPAGYTSTNAIAETVAAATDHSTAAKDTNDRIRVLFDNAVTTEYSAGNVFLARLAQQDQTITFAQPTSAAVYGSTFNVNPTASSGLPVSLTAGGSCSIAAASPGWTVTMTSGTGNCVLTASQAGDSNWNPAPNVQRTVAASKATLSINAPGHSKVYGELDPAATYTLSGFVGTENASSAGVTGVPNCTIGIHSEAVGSYPGTYSCATGSLTAANYTFVAGTTGTLSITKAQLTVTANDKSRDYGAANPTFNATITGFVNGQTLATSDVTGTPACTSTATAASPVGDYDITCTTGTLASDNYTFTFATGTLHVTKAQLTVTANDKSRDYGAANPTFNATITGFVNGQTLATSDVTGTPACTSTATAASPVGDYDITCTTGTLASDNYTFTFATGTLHVTKAQLTVTANDKSRDYGAANPTFNATITGFVNGQTLATSDVTGTPACTSTATAASPVGDYDITCTTGTLASDNYTFTFATGTLHVTKAQLTVTANDKSRDYGAANPTFNATITGFVNGQTLATSDVTGTPACTSTATAASPVGDYDITCTTGTLASDNYTFTFATGTLHVTKAQLTVTANDKSRDYGAANPTFNATITGFVNGQTLATSDVTGTPACTSTATAASPVGDYDITCTTGTLASDNYTFTFATGTLHVTPAVLSVNAPGHSKTFGSADPAATYSLTGFVGADTVANVTITGAPTCSIASHSQDVGSYPNTYSCTPGNLATGNYTFVAGAKGTLTITALAGTVTVTASAASVQFSDQITLNAAISPTLVNGSQLTGTVQFSVAGEPVIAPVSVDSSGHASATITMSGRLLPVTSTSLSRTVTAAFTSSNPNFADTSGSGSLTETLEGAKIDYTGDGLKLTASASTSTATVNLAAVVKEDADSSTGGKLDNASVKFTVYKSTDSTLSSPVGTCSSALTLAAPGSGTANGGCTLTLGVDNYVVEIELLPNGYYAAPTEDVAVTVAVPGTGFTNGGGWLTEPTLGTRSNFGFTAKMLKKGTQGNSLYIYRRTVAANTIANPSGGYLPAGDYNWIIKSNAMDQLAEACTTTKPVICTATFTGKSNVTAANRETGVAYSLGGNRQFQVDVTDKGEPGSSSSTTPDTYAIRVWDGNGTYYQLGTSAAQVPITGGNIQVRP